MIPPLIVLSLFGIWFLASLVNQFRPSLRSRLWRFDLVFIIPLWRLFVRTAENYRLYYRDRFEDGTIEAWREIPWRIHKTGVSWLCNPSFWLTLDVAQLAARLPLIAQRRGSPNVQYTMLYRLIQSYICSFPRLSQSHARQFKVMQVPGHIPNSDAADVFVSGFHSW